jgi:glycosyltransferase involved in cell wall biosynthesis
MRQKYVLVTPVYNEEKYIEETIKCVLAQTRRPVRWIIVNDGSTDSTGDIVRCYAASHSFIQCYDHDKTKVKDSYYGYRTRAFLAGYDLLVKDESYEYVGCLDADISLPENYYEKILVEFERHPELGITSGVYCEKVGERCREVKIARNHTPGALQLFRRECYEEIGGYWPLRYGGDDSLAEIMARTMGWQTWSFRHIRVVHHRPVGTGDGKSLVIARFKHGLTDYTLGSHPMFMLFKFMRRCFIDRPLVISGFAGFLGFLSGYLKREEQPIPQEVKKYLRSEQCKRLLAAAGLGPRLWEPAVSE